MGRRCVPDQKALTCANAIRIRKRAAIIEQVVGRIIGFEKVADRPRALVAPGTVAEQEQRTQV